MIGYGAQRLMELEVESRTGATLNARDPDNRLTHRNGYRARDWETRGMLAQREKKTQGVMPTFRAWLIPS